METFIKTRMTSAEFLELPESNLPTELIEGEFVQMPAPPAIHQRLIRWLYDILSKLVTEGEFWFSPIDVLIDDYHVVQPDLFWVAPNSNCMLIDDHYFLGAPDLVIEVLSKSTSKRDKDDKFKLYEKYGVKEYWILDPKNSDIEVWQHQDGRFSLVGIFEEGDTFQSPLLQHTIDLKTIFKA
jgi:Uma2 family endonuclease